MDRTSYPVWNNSENFISKIVAAIVRSYGVWLNWKTLTLVKDHSPFDVLYTEVLSLAGAESPKALVKRVDCERRYQYPCLIKIQPKRLWSATLQLQVILFAKDYQKTRYTSDYRTRTIALNYQRWSPRGRPWFRGHYLKSLALGLVAYRFSKMSCLRLEDSIIIDWLKRKITKQKIT